MIVPCKIIFSCCCFILLVAHVPFTPAEMCVCRLMQHAESASEADLRAGLVNAKGVAVLHKYAGPQLADVTIDLGGAS